MNPAHIKQALATSPYTKELPAVVRDAYVITSGGARDCIVHTCGMDLHTTLHDSPFGAFATVQGTVVPTTRVA